MLVRVVSLFGLSMILLGIKYLAAEQMAQVLILNFVIFGIAMCLVTLMYVVMIIFLYFDRREYALGITAIFMITNVVGVALERVFEFQIIGLAITCAAGLSLLTGLIMFKRFVRNMDYYIYRA
jgi:uncharacterized membrane protein